MDLDEAGKERYWQLDELEEFRQQAYENSSIYKERTKASHDRRIRMREFKEGDKVLLFNSRFKLKAPKLRSKWTGPFEVINGYPSGQVKLHGHSGDGFIVNGQRVKHYYEEDSNKDEGIESGPYFVDE
uniref:uncharacterized protein LOC122604384 n=1 Tax=Erigeron canadensis TaxID=72917 RepID=UPI001CB9450F|nr:uncharacterized protein LOC122604384 [Erigeron canadensis]